MSHLDRARARTAARDATPGALIPTTDPHGYIRLARRLASAGRWLFVGALIGGLFAIAHAMIAGAS